MFTLPVFVLVPSVMVAFGVAILGLTAFLKLPFGNTDFTLDELWSMIFLAFISGFSVQFYQAKSAEFAHIAFEVPGDYVRRIIAVAVFVLAYSMASDFSIEPQAIEHAIPRALLALGVFLVIVALPWHSAAALSELESRKTRSSFSRYTVEGMQHESPVWIYIATYSNYDGHMNAMIREQQEADSGKWKELRVLFESGSVEVVTHRTKEKATNSNG